MEVGFLPRLHVCVLKSASRAAAPQPARRRPPRTTQPCSSGDCHNYLWLTFLRHCPQTAKMRAPHSPPNTRCPPHPPPAVHRKGDIQCEGAWRDKGFLRSSFCLPVAGRRLPIQGLAALPGAAAPATHPWGTQGCPALLPLPTACSCSSPSRAGDTHNLRGAQRASRAIVVLTFIMKNKITSSSCWLGPETPLSFLQAFVKYPGIRTLCRLLVSQCSCC